MSVEELFDKLYNCLVDLDKDCVLDNVIKLLDMGVKALDIVLGPMSKAMEEIGRLYEEGEYFIAELMEAADIFKEAMKILEPRLRLEAKSMAQGRKRLRIVLATVKGDIHDIGKTLVGVMLQAAGHEVIDLGVDVDAEKIIDAIIKYKPQIIGLSALLSTTARYMRVIIEELEKNGLREKVKVLVGGAATTREFAEKIGADGWAPNAIEAVKLVNKIAEEYIDA
ncbi:cobalamin B12-binding domain protein [Staphylothermus marinus F1]|uniref:Cobalamin B12-binding domain protein n=1 Tax=Staphylothermus marinus (strain ATCC 43588 / DSM 3639 / JCM 9404 / F1) TaxID=399550 RepID=A3DLL6_STAMF|nr:cobalamin-binding protein [Staphylothermus marinus]ABN69526.1 cobalamin B12-binding domain protein [Staphylothermus marinus F1]